MWPLLVGLALTLTGWTLTRIEARVRNSWSLALVIDIGPPLLMFALFLAMTARPIFAGVITFALMGGFAFLDWVKRETLREPVVFSDLGEAIELFRHPRLYLPFAGPTRVIATAAAAAVALIALLVVEPPQWSWSPWPPLIVFGGAVGFGWVVHGPKLEWAARRLRRLNLSGDPIADASLLGLCAVQLIYSQIARDERGARRAQANLRTPAIIVRPSSAAAPVMVVQCESFFDPRRLHAGIPSDIVPAFDNCCRSGIRWGNLTVPGWGANTMRAEFAVMTGLPEEAIGLDRFNPYFAFARAPLASLARRMRADGHRTICLHPFDRTFYRRDEVMPHLGFDVFLGEEAFSGATRVGHYIADTEVARVAVDILREERSPIFLFAITMDNHGPWLPITPDAPKHERFAGVPSTSEDGELAQFLSGVRRSDAMLGHLTEALSERAGMCAFYGDHLPSLPATFAACGFDEISTDYAIWHPDAATPVRRDLAAHELSDAIFEAYRATRSGL